MPRKFPKLLTHVPPIWNENVCDSTNGKKICVRFAITISAVRSLQVTRLILVLADLYNFRSYSKAMKIGRFLCFVLAY